MEKPKLKNYEDHAFVQKVVADYAWFYKNPSSDLSKASYCRKVYTALSRVKSILKTLQFSRVLLAEINSVNDKNYNSTLPKAVVRKYHLEVYFLRLTTYKDLVVQLIAVVNQWNIAANNGAVKNLQKKSTEEGKTHVEALLNSLDKLLSTAKPIRNLIAHEGSTTDPDILLPELYYNLKEFIETLPADLVKGELGLPEQDMMEVYESLTTARSIKDMMENEQDMATHLFTVLDHLLPDYIAVIPENNSLFAR